MTREQRPIGYLHASQKTEGGHPANGMTAHLHVGDGAWMTLQNPQSFGGGGVGWHLNHGNVEAVRYVAAGLLESYDYLLSAEIPMKEAVQRLRLLRAARRQLCSAPSVVQAVKPGEQT